MDALSKDACALMRGAFIDENDNLIIVSNNDEALEEIERHGYTYEICATANPHYFVCELNEKGAEHREELLDAEIKEN